MKFRDAQQMMEIARLKLHISEMREKEARLQAQILAAFAENPDGPKHQNDSGQRLAALDQQIKYACTQIDNLQSLVDSLRDEISEKNNMAKELVLAKATIKQLQEEVGDDVKVTKTKLMALKRQLSELERTEKANMQKEEDHRKLSEGIRNLEAEVTGLKQGNEELLLQNKALRQKIMEAKQKAEELSTHTMDSAMAEVSKLRSTNYDLRKMVEDLQSSRFNEVEELVYLRWVNACLRHDVDACKASHNEADDMSDSSSNKHGSPHASQRRNMDEHAISHSQGSDENRCSSQALADGHKDHKDIVERQPTSFSERDPTRIQPVKSLSTISQNLSRRRNFSLGSRLETPMNQTRKGLHNDQRKSSTDIWSGPMVVTNNSMTAKFQRGYSMPSDMFPTENSQFSRMRSSDGHLKSTSFDREMYKSSLPSWDTEWSDSEISPLSLTRYKADYSVSDNLQISVDHNNALGMVASAFKILSKSAKMGNSIPVFKDLPSQHEHKEERLLKTGEQLMLEWHKSSPDDTSLQLAVANALMEHPQTHKGAAQNDFVQDLAQSVRVTSYRSIEDVVAFIEWLDRQVDNEVFVSCKDWPTKRVDAMRWAVREFQKLKQLESEIGCFIDEPEGPPDLIIKEMLNVQQKAEKYVGDFMQARDWIVGQFEMLNLPTDWMLESGIVAKVKLGSDQLLRKCARKAQELRR